jgi:protein TonB
VFQPIQVLADALPERFRRGLGRRATGFAAALLIEALLFLLLLALEQTPEQKKPPLVTLSSFDVTPPAPPPAAPQPKAQALPLTRPVPTPPQPVPPQPQPTATPPPMIVLPHDEANFSLADLPKAPAPPAKPQAAFGPPDTGSPGDSKRVGTAPDGSPLYGARWYREPTDAELAVGSAWGRIACKTAPDFRVDHCVIVDEYPENSHLGNAVLSAAWQFRVRPPWKNGQSLIGSWVQITIYSDPDEKPRYGK